MLATNSSLSCASENLYFLVLAMKDCNISRFSDGVGRSGTFLCIHSQLERLKTEGVVDVFQAVKSAH